MFVYRSFRRQCLGKFKSFWVVFSNQPLCNKKTWVRGLCSFCQFKRVPNRQTGVSRLRKVSKPVRKEDVDPQVYTRNLVRNVSNILRYSTWDSATERLSKLTVKWDSFVVNQVLKTHPPLEKAWLFFNWASRLVGFKHDQFTYTTMLDIFGEAGRISSMIYVFKEMQEKGVKIDAVTYTSLMHWLSNDGDIDGSMKLWDEMKAKGCFPTVVSYTACMKILFAHNREKAGVGVYKEMLQAGCTPNCFTYTILMEHLAAKGKFEDALEIFNKMQETGVEPDKAACNILVEKCCDFGETRAMNKILQYMRDNFLVLRFPVYLKALETLKAFGESDFLLGQVNRHCSTEHTKLDSNGPSITTTDVLSVIDRGLVLLLLHRHNFVAVDCIIKSMMEQSIVLDSGVISVIIEVNSVHYRSKSALLAFEYSRKSGLSIDRAAYFSLMGLFIRMDSLPRVIQIFENMVRDGIFPGTYLTGLLIYRLGRARRLVAAAKIFDLLADERKGTTAYTALLGAYFYAGDAFRGLQTLKTMRRRGLPVALGTYNLLIAGLEKCGRLHDSECYKKEKKRLQAITQTGNGVPVEEQICNLLFAGDLVF